MLWITSGKFQKWGHQKRSNCERKDASRMIDPKAPCRFGFIMPMIAIGFAVGFAVGFASFAWLLVHCDPLVR